MKRLPCLALLLALPLLTCAQASEKGKASKPTVTLPKASPTPAQANAAAAQEVEKLERQRFEAQVSKDYTFLEKAFADDLVYTHSNGKQNTKTEYLQSIRKGKSVYDKSEVENLNVRAYNNGQVAVVNGQIIICQPTKPDGTPNIAHLKYVTTQIKDPKNGWQVVVWQSQKQAEAK